MTDIIPERLQRALSIRQPFAELILQGEKRAEYRSRRTLIRERVYIYASKRVDAGDVAGLLPRGVIVGSVEICDCQVWGAGGFAWYLIEPRRYAEPLTQFTGTPQPSFWFPRF